MSALYQWVSDSVLGALPAGGDTCAHKVLARRVVKRGDGGVEEKVHLMRSYDPYSRMVVILGIEATGMLWNQNKGLDP